MSEGNFYLVNWRKKAGEHYLILQKNKAVKAHHCDLDEAKDALYQAIAEYYGDGEAHLELVAKGHKANEWVILEPYEEYHLSNADDALFEGGLCGGCGFAIGGRTITALACQHKLKGEVGYFNNLKPWLYFFSSALLDALEQAGGRKFNRRTLVKEEQALTFEELLDDVQNCYQLPLETKLNVEGRGSFECNHCRRISYVGQMPQNDIYFAIESVRKHKIQVVQSNWLHQKTLLVHCSVLEQLKQSGAGRKFYTTPVQLKPQSELYVPTGLPKVDLIDWG